MAIHGTGRDVISANTFRLSADGGSLVLVHLANVEDTSDPLAVSRLRELVAGKTLTVLVSQEDKEVTSEVHDLQGTDIAHELLRTGAVRFAESPPYALSHHSECLNRIAEREARAAGLGIWKR